MKKIENITLEYSISIFDLDDEIIKKIIKNSKFPFFGTRPIYMKIPESSENEPPFEIYIDQIVTNITNYDLEIKVILSIKKYKDKKDRIDEFIISILKEIEKELQHVSITRNDINLLYPNIIRIKEMRTDINENSKNIRLLTAKMETMQQEKTNLLNTIDLLKEEINSIKNNKIHNTDVDLIT